MSTEIYKAILAKAAQARKEAQVPVPAPAPAPAPAVIPTAGQALQSAEAARLHDQALSNLKNLALLSLGVGAAGRGALGVASLFKPSKPKSRSGPVPLPLPYPAETKVAATIAGSLNGMYAPAMLATGMAGLGAGWKGIDMLIEAQRRKETEARLGKAKTEFHDALLSQYDQPLAAGGLKAAAAPTTMQEVGRTLDRVWEKFATLVAQTQKQAGWLGDTKDRVLGGYGLYALGSGLSAGAWAYERAAKRSRRALIEKALKKRQQAEFAKSPPPIYATPEPISSLPAPPRVETLQQQVDEV